MHHGRRRGKRISHGRSAVVDAEPTTLIWRAPERAEVRDRVSRRDCFAPQARNETHDANGENTDGDPMPCFETAFD